MNIVVQPPSLISYTLYTYPILGNRTSQKPTTFQLFLHPWQYDFWTFCSTSWKGKKISVEEFPQAASLAAHDYVAKTFNKH